MEKCCTPQQIEEKKRAALEKLKSKHGSFSISGSSNQNQPPQLPKTPNTKHVQSFCETKVNADGKMKQKKNFTTKPAYQPYTVPQKSPKVDIPPISANLFFDNKTCTVCKMQLISEKRFVVITNAFHQKLVEEFKQIPSRVFENASKNWNFHVSDYDNLMERLNKLYPEVKVEPIPKKVIKSMLKIEEDPRTADLSSIEPELLNSLLPFQREGVCFGIQKNGRCLIADEMGLGKTFQALALASYYKREWPLLITTTSSTKKTWEEKIEKYLTSVPINYIFHMQSAKDFINDSKIVIVSYDMLSRAFNKLKEKKFGVLIMDESQTLKNFKTKCTQAAISLSKLATRVILLSGTPALSRPSELFTQISLINNKYFKDFMEYSIRYCDGHNTPFGWNANGQSNLQELELLLNKEFMIRRKKAEVLDLPEKKREIVKLNQTFLKLSKEELKSLNYLASDYGRKKKGSEKQAALLTFFSETAKLKIKAVCTYLKDFLEEKKEKTLVFAHHQSMLNGICDLLHRLKITYIKIDGKTNADQRQHFINKFNTLDSCLCAVLSITAANAGITLTAARFVMFAEIHWNPSILTQAESRAHRIGQENEVHVRYLLAEGTADDYMWEIIQNKTDVLNEVGLFADSFKDATETKQNSDITNFDSPQKRIENYFSSVTKDTSINASFLEDEFTLDCEGDEELANLVF